MHRLERRMIVVAGRRRQGVDASALRAETRRRAVALRRVRGLLRQGHLTLLQHPRWADVPGAFEDLEQDLLLASPAIRAVRVDLATHRGTGPKAWARLLDVLASAVGAPMPSAAAWPMSREGFRFGLHTLLEACRHAPPRAILAAGAHHVSVDVLSDLADVWAQWARPGDTGTPVRLLLAVRHANVAHLPAAARVVDLPDWSPAELVDHFIGWLGCTPSTARGLARATGGLPDAVRATIAGFRAAEGPLEGVVFHGLGGLRPRLEATLRAARADTDLADRLDELLHTAQPSVPVADPTLVRAGLARTELGPNGWMTELRSPVLRALDRALTGFAEGREPVG